MGLRTSSLIVLVFTFLWSCSIGLSCPEGTYRGDSDLCCKLCPLGTHLLLPCNESTGESFCQPCPPETYMDKINNEKQCFPCKRCDPTQIALSECKATQNRKCDCEAGKFLEPSFLYCKDCKKCHKGEGVVSPCSGNSDTKCAPCVKGSTFSNNASETERCKPCTQCRGMMIEKEACNVSRDTVCERANETETTTARTTVTKHITSGPLSEVTTIKEEATGYSEPAISDQPGMAFRVYVLAIVAAVFVVVVILVAVLCFFMRKARDANGSNSVPSDTPARTRSSQGLRGRRTTNSRSSNQNSRESEALESSCPLHGINIGGGTKSKTMVRDLPSHIYIELGKFLNPKSLNNWVTLAGRLGFNNNDVQNFNIYPDQATQKVLDEWGQKDGSTVDILIYELKEMNRADCVQVLKPWDS
ncbi:tumor necrosis factor receptor superfamily member 16-like isoform X4 [Montipora foliosa]|uniref:tumor necrosis factor receptor superfamily member 16-like isoform X4 n=1 Tax=Montipora foliosa TaxID=591990 RepID=UPI0035F175F1